jgi:hypothetical protein
MKMTAADPTYQTFAVAVAVNFGFTMPSEEAP